MSALDDELNRRITRGINFFDTTILGWRKKINVDQLRMNDPRKCVLAQVYGPYRTALRELKIRPDQAIEYCFTLRTTEFAAGWKKIWDKTWKKRLSE